MIWKNFIPTRNIRPMIRIINKYFIILVAIGFLIVEFRYGRLDNDHAKEERLPVRVIPFRTSAGWGYEIDVDGKPFIHQDFIPAVQGKQSFKSPEDALKVGQLLVEKMKNNKRPIITVSELKGMSIKVS